MNTNTRSTAQNLKNLFSNMENQTPAEAGFKPQSLPGKVTAAGVLFTLIDTAACPWGSPCGSLQGGRRWCLRSGCGSERFSPLEYKHRANHRSRSEAAINNNS